VADEFLGPDVRLAERIELVDQPFRVNPHSACPAILNWPAPPETITVPSMSPCSAIEPQARLRSAPDWDGP
jgi:hypothetical protein